LSLLSESTFLCSFLATGFSAETSVLAASVLTAVLTASDLTSTFLTGFSSRLLELRSIYQPEQDQL
jgi:hypothetical protein